VILGEVSVDKSKHNNGTERLLQVLKQILHGIYQIRDRYCVHQDLPATSFQLDARFSRGLEGSANCTKLQIWKVKPCLYFELSPSSFRLKMHKELDANGFRKAKGGMGIP